MRAAAVPAAAEVELTNPYLDRNAAIAQGERLYRTRCVGCHKSQGGSGPNVFRIKLSPGQFFGTVANGRKGTAMPAFGKLLFARRDLAIHVLLGLANGL